MSEDDLKAMGVLLPKEEWGEKELTSTLNKQLLIFIFISVIIASVLMYFGNGDWLTWTGASIFFVALIIFSVHTMRAIDKQNDVLRRTHSIDNSEDNN